MPRFAANLSSLFREQPLLDRMAAAAAVGFKGVAFHFPYTDEAHLIADKAAMAGVKITSFTAPPGNYAAGERGLAALPDRQKDFREAFEVALNFADELECPAIHVMAGNAAEWHHDDAMESYLTNLAWAADHAKEEGVRVLIQPIFNDAYFLRQPEDAVAVIETLERKNVRLLLDVAEAQRAECDVVPFLEAYLPLIDLIQISSADRHEPSKAEYQQLYDLLDAHGFPGWVSADYAPRGETAAGLAWAKDWGIKAR